MLVFGVQLARVHPPDHAIRGAGEHCRVVLVRMRVEDHLHHERAPAVPENRHRDFGVLRADYPGELRDRTRYGSKASDS